MSEFIFGILKRSLYNSGKMLMIKNMTNLSFLAFYFNFRKFFLQIEFFLWYFLGMLHIYTYFEPISCHQCKHIKVSINFKI